MTAAQLKRKIRECRKRDNAHITNHINSAIKSGAFNISDYEDNFLLAKIVLSAVYSEMSWQYEPLTKDGKKEVENLKKFL